MQAEPSKESLLHTLRMFWTGKRFLKLFIFALLMGNVALYCVGMIARRQVFNNVINHHNKVYTAYLQSVERARKAPVVTPATPAATTTTEAPVSPYWTGLKEIRRQFVYHRTNVLIQSATDSERDRKVLDMMKNRPRGWSITDEADGWARTFYVLPTRNTAAFQVVSYVRDDLAAWEKTAVVIGAYSFMLLFAFGWFWTRALDTDPAGDTRGMVSAELKQRLKALNGVAQALGDALNEAQNSIAVLEKKSVTDNIDLVKTLDELASQARILAVNGSIEAARSPDTYRVFHVIMQEINQIATQSREILKTMGNQVHGVQLTELRDRLNHIQTLIDPKAATEPSDVDSSRRAG